jgi:hypothetical protein
MESARGKKMHRSCAFAQDDDASNCYSPQFCVIIR